MIKDQDYLFKIVIVGNQGVGKSSLFLRFCDNNFIQNYLTTIGVDFRFRMLQVQQKMCKLQIWDTAGQQRFRTITSAYYRNSQAVLIVYDVTDPQSFRQIQQYWLQQVKANTDSDVLIVLVGNKCDQPSFISDAQINSLIQPLGLPSYFLSAKSAKYVRHQYLTASQENLKQNLLKEDQMIKTIDKKSVVEDDKNSGKKTFIKQTKRRT